MEERRYWSRQLEDAVRIGDRNLANTAINWLIYIRTHVVIKSQGAGFFCYSHVMYFNQNYCVPDASSLYQAFSCQHGHLLCSECLLYSVQMHFPTHKVFGIYECPGCLRIHSAGSELLNPESKEAALRSLLGNERIDHELATVNPQFAPVQNTYQLCVVCNAPNPDRISLCKHKMCKPCLKNYMQANQGSEQWQCPGQACKYFILHTVIYDAICTDNALLGAVYDKLDLGGRKVLLCPNCQKKHETDSDSTGDITCGCGNRLCSLCGQPSHIGLSCKVAAMKINEYQIIDITAQSHPQEYAYAKMQFDYFTQDSSLSMRQAKLIVNPAMLARFEKKKEELVKACNGDDTEVIVFHGSRQQNYDNIARGGFLIGGVSPGVDVVNGAVLGLGVYTATTPDLPVVYAWDSNWLLCCRGVRGQASSQAAGTAQELTSGPCHSYVLNEIIVFWTVEQVLPLYLIEFNR